MKDYLDIMCENEKLWYSIPEDEYFYPGQRIIIYISDIIGDSILSYKEINKFLVENQLILVNFVEDHIIVEFTTTMRS